MMSIRIGVTGGMGSGKTYVCQLLEKRGIPVFYTDTEAKRLIVDDSGVRQRLKDIVGNSLYNQEVGQKGDGILSCTRKTMGRPSECRCSSCCQKSNVRMVCCTTKPPYSSGGVCIAF